MVPSVVMIQRKGGGGVGTLMGMSNDFEADLKSGSDIVRVGTGIFGQRPSNSKLI